MYGRDKKLRKLLVNLFFMSSEIKTKKKINKNIIIRGLSLMAARKFPLRS
jgi:hypothetical protein